MPSASRGIGARRLWRWLRWGFGLLIAGALLGGSALVLVLRHYGRDLPSAATLKGGYDPPQVTRIMAREGTLLASLFRERRTVIEFSEVPDGAKLAFLAAEDAHFYEHEGLNYLGMLRALLVNLRAQRSRQGGSTITQQVVKNVLLTPERSLERKVKEALLALRLEQHLTKDEIFSLYLNHIYLGHGRYGIEEASRYYFGKKARALTVAEAATLAGAIASPERYSPRKHPERALARRRFVLEQMRNKGFVTQELFEVAEAAPLRLVPAAEAESDLAPEIVAAAQKALGPVVGEPLTRGGYEVITTLDPQLQAAARAALRQGLDAGDVRRGIVAPFTAKKRSDWGGPFEGTPRAHGIYTGRVISADDAAGTLRVQVGDTVGRVILAQNERYNPKQLAPSAFARAGAVLRVRVLEEPAPEEPVPLRLELGPQGALVALDVRTGEVLAQVGSYEGLPGGLDRATQAKRQPGSTFKALVYGYALQSRRYTPATMLTLTQRRGHGQRADDSGTMSVRHALAHSNNEAATQLLKGAGPANVVAFARALGISSRLEPDQALALGAYEVTLLELVGAYATFARGGELRSPRLVSRVTGPGGAEISLPEGPPARRVIGEDVAYLTTSLLRSVVTDGTGRLARKLGRPVAGKTGTTNDNKDAWFVGYSTELVAGVWVGFDDARSLGKGESGARAALPVWVEFMRRAHRDRPDTDFARPASVVVERIDPATGMLPYFGQEDAITEEFLEGTVPTEATERPGSEADAGSAAPVDEKGPASLDSGRVPAQPEDELPPPF